MSKDGIVYLLMIFNVNTYANVILEPSLRANEGHICVNKSILTLMKQILTQMNVYFLEMDSKMCIIIIIIYYYDVPRKTSSTFQHLLSFQLFCCFCKRNKKIK